MKARYWAAAAAWITTIAIAFVAGERQALESDALAPSTVAEPTEPPVIGRTLPSPSRIAPNRPPGLGFDVRTVRDAVLPPPRPESKSELAHLIDDLGVISADLEDEERDRFLHHLAISLVNFDPAFALQWAAGLEVSDSLREELTAGILSRWSQRDPEAAMQALGDLTDPSTRMAAVNAMALSLAMQGTERAVNWADSLATPAEQDAAHAAIYDATPRGIGASLSLKDGAVHVNNVMEGGPAAASGQIHKGDRILAVDSGSGEFQNLTGSNLTDVIGLIRGENGTPLRLRIERDTESGPQTIIVPLIRDQIIIPERN